jgi:hypothetical protein
MDPPTVVWARKHISTDECPKTEITAESVGFIEIFQARKTLRGANVESLPARTVEAMLLLENELQRERNDVETQTY